MFSFGSARGSAEATIYRRTADARRIAQRIMPAAELIAALLFSLGLWGVVWLVVSSLVSAWPR